MRFAQRNSNGSFSGTRLSSRLAKTGIRVSAQTSEAVSAKTTVSAIGRNIFPSTPRRAWIGR